MKKVTFLLTALAVALLCAAGATAQERAPIKVGMSTALEGSAAPLGQGMRAGVEAAFAEQNARGGVHGRPLELIVLDDGYEPGRAAPNMRALIDQRGVFAVIGNVGTPTAAVAVPIANEKKIPFWGAFTGAGLLRKSPPDRYVFNYRASYAEETAQIIQGALDQMGVSPDKIGFFTQNDAYGDSGYVGAVQALKARGYDRAERLVHARYTRNTMDVEEGLSRLLDPPRPARGRHHGRDRRALRADDPPRARARLPPDLRRRLLRGRRRAPEAPGARAGRGPRHLAGGPTPRRERPPRRRRLPRRAP